MSKVERARSKIGDRSQMGGGKSSKMGITVACENFTFPRTEYVVGEFV